MQTLQGYSLSFAMVVVVFDPRSRTSQRIVRYDLRELLPLLRHRWQPNNPEVRKVLERDRNLHMEYPPNPMRGSLPVFGPERPPVSSP